MSEAGRASSRFPFAVASEKNALHNEHTRIDDANHHALCGRRACNEKSSRRVFSTATACFYEKRRLHENRSRLRNTAAVATKFDDLL
jgi:hypothetical protein